jgi:hypothetical protein
LGEDINLLVVSLTLLETEFGAHLGNQKVYYQIMAFFSLILTWLIMLMLFWMCFMASDKQTFGAETWATKHAIFYI